MRKFIILLALILVPGFCFAESVETWSNPNANVKKRIVRTVDTARTSGAIVRRDSDGNFETGELLSAQYGAGALGTSDLGGPETYRRIEDGTIIQK